MIMIQEKDFETEALRVAEAAKEKSSEPSTGLATEGHSQPSGKTWAWRGRVWREKHANSSRD